MMKNIFMIKLSISRVFFALLLMMLFSCSYKPKIEVYYLGEGVLQYFARPSGMSAKDADLDIDFTMRPEVEGWPVITNFTIILDEYQKKNVKQAYFKLDNDEIIQADSIQMLYKTASKGMIRYTSVIDFEAFKQMTNAKEVSFVVKYEKDSSVFDADRDFYKRMENIALEIE